MRLFVYDTLVNVNVAYIMYMYVNKARWARSAGNSAIENLCLIIIIIYYSEISPEVTLRPPSTSCAKDYKGHSLVQITFTEPPNMSMLYR